MDSKRGWRRTSPNGPRSWPTPISRAFSVYPGEWNQWERQTRRRFSDQPGETIVQRAIAILAAALWLALGATAAAQTSPAQSWPTRTVRIVIPLAARGGGELFARLLADEFQKKYGQPFVVENRPGGGLNIGARACAEAPPDGYTLCVMSSEPVVYNQFLFRSLPFNPEKDFEP